MSYCPGKESNISRDFQSSKFLAKENPPYILHVKPHRKIPHQICGVLHYTVNMTLYLRQRTGFLWCQYVQTLFDALVLYKAESRSHLSSEALSSTFRQGKFLSTFQQVNSYFQLMIYHKHPTQQLLQQPVFSLYISNFNDGFHYTMWDDH